jgi:hypothetical protein
MNLFKKVLIIGLATMALGSAAMGDPGKDAKAADSKCESINALPNAQTNKPLDQKSDGTPPAIPGTKSDNASG